jgi:hypothetical protein
MGKTRDLSKKIRDTKGTFQAKMNPIKDRNGINLTEAENIEKRWQEYTEELYIYSVDENARYITTISFNSLTSFIITFQK